MRLLQELIVGPLPSAVTHVPVPYRTVWRYEAGWVAWCLQIVANDISIQPRQARLAAH